MTKARTSKPFEHFWAVFDDGSTERITDEKTLEEIMEARRQVAQYRDIFPQGTTEWFRWHKSEHQQVLVNARAATNASKTRKKRSVKNEEGRRRRVKITGAALKEFYDKYARWNEGSAWGWLEAAKSEFGIADARTIKAILKRDGVVLN